MAVKKRAASACLLAVSSAKISEMKEKKLLATILISIFGHLTVLSLGFMLLELDLFTRSSDSEKQLFQVETISPAQLKKYKMVGSKDGKENLFSMPITSPLSLSQLRGNNIKATLASRPAPQPVAQVVSSQVALQEKIKKQIVQELLPSMPNQKLINAADFHIKFEPPKGVSEDELNSVEKIFYSFYQRSYKNYLSSFIQSYNTLMQDRPYLKEKISSKSHGLSGKVIFDREGNIVSIKIIQWSDDDNIQALFEQTLKNMNPLYNPPKELIQENGEFALYYRLLVN